MSGEAPTPTERGVAVVGGPKHAKAVTAEGGGATDDVETASAAPPARRPQSRTVAPRRPGDRPWLVPALAVLSAISILCAIVFGVKWSDLSAQNDTRATVQRVAKDFLTALTNFTPKTIDADFRTISTYATGDFAKQSNQFFGSSIRQQLEQAQAWSRGQFRYEYVQSLDGPQASVYSEVDQTYANDKVTTPITDVLQVVLALTDTSGGWKISAVTVLQPPSSTGSPTGKAASPGK